MKRNRVLFHPLSFHIFQFFIVFYKPAQATVTPWYGRVIIWFLEMQCNGRAARTSFMHWRCEGYTSWGRFWMTSCCRFGVNVRLVQQFFFENRNVFKQVLPWKDFSRSLFVHMIEQQLYNVWAVLQHVFIYHLKVMAYTQIWKFLDFPKQRTSLLVVCKLDLGILMTS